MYSHAMGVFSPPPGSSRQHHSSRSNQHQNGHFFNPLTPLDHCGGGDGNDSRKRFRPAVSGGSSHLFPDPPMAVGSSPDARVYAEFRPVSNEYQYYREYDNAANSNGYRATEGSNASQGYHGQYGHTEGASNLTSTSARRGDLAEDAAAAAAAAASAASEDYYTVSVSSAMAGQVHEAGMQFHSFKRSPPTTLTNPANSVCRGDDGSKLYALPNDETEQNRDDMKHSMALLLMQDHLFYSPVDAQLRSGGMVYDLGTGTGIWAIDGKIFARNCVFDWFSNSINSCRKVPQHRRQGHRSFAHPASLRATQSQLFYR